MTKVQRFADEAVFILQLNSREAIKYIQRNAEVSLEAAELVFKSTVLPVK